MKKYPLILLILCASLIHARAQDDRPFPDMRSWMIEPRDTSDRYIFADTAFVRVSPDTHKAPQDTLFAGDNIKVVGITEKKLSIHGLMGPWLKISYTKNGQSKEGFIWQGLISLAPMRRGDTKFVCGIERRADSIVMDGQKKDTIRRFLVRLKVVQKAVVLSRTSLLTPDDESANFFFGKLMSGMGLTNVDNMVVLEFSGEACAIPAYDYYFAWTKSGQLVRFPDKTNVSDAGVFYHEEKFTFPSETKGQPNTLTWNMITAEATDELDKKGEPIFKTTEKKKKTFTWDPIGEKVSD